LKILIFACKKTPSFKDAFGLEYLDGKSKIRNINAGLANKIMGEDELLFSYLSSTHL
jgi:hypothetical protein